jgi:hypothetical protein
MFDRQSVPGRKNMIVPEIHVIICLRVCVCVRLTGNCVFRLHNFTGLHYYTKLELDSDGSVVGEIVIVKCLYTHV